MVCENNCIEEHSPTLLSFTGTVFMASIRHNFPAAVTNQLRFALSCFVAIAALGISNANAFYIDLHLDVDYIDGNSSNGGTWTLAAQTGGQGLFALGIGLTGIDAAVDFHLPSGTVNGADDAGFSILLNNSMSGGRQIYAAQQALPTSAGEQGAFYGVGTLNNGAPNSPVSPPGTNTAGPLISSLSALNNVAWATGHVTTTFDVASGTFSAGNSPDIDFFSPLNQGLIFTSVPGSSSDIGDIEEAFLFYAEYTTNLGVPIEQGDFNGDDVVDAADYTLWRDTLGQTVFPGTNADASGNGLIDAADYTIWAANYGTSSPSSLASASAVPEPTAAVLLLLGALFGSARRNMTIA